VYTDIHSSASILFKKTELCVDSVVTFLDMSCRGKLAKLDEKLTLMEQKVEYIEARVCENLYMNINMYVFIPFDVLNYVLQVTKGEALS
jgi:hypothetical protein